MLQFKKLSPDSEIHMQKEACTLSKDKALPPWYGDEVQQQLNHKQNKIK